MAIEFKMDKELETLTKRIKDFFFVYFDTSTMRKVKTPEIALAFIRDRLESTHMSHGRLMSFRNILQDIQLWQSLLLNQKD